MLNLQDPPRPVWRDEFATDEEAAKRYADAMRRWQVRSIDAFERADAALWMALSDDQRCEVCFRVQVMLDTWGTDFLRRYWQMENLHLALLDRMPMSESQLPNDDQPRIGAVADPDPFPAR
jgi:hypothetical protein